MIRRFWSKGLGLARPATYPKPVSSEYRVELLQMETPRLSSMATNCNSRPLAGYKQ